MNKLKGTADAVKKKQTLLIVVSGVGILGLCLVAAVMTTTSEPLPEPPAPEAKLISVPGGTGDEKTNWKLNESKRLEGQNIALNEQLAVLKKRLEDVERMNAETALPKQELAQSPRILPPPPPPVSRPSVADPLPVPTTQSPQGLSAVPGAPESATMGQAIVKAPGITTLTFAEPASAKPAKVAAADRPLGIDDANSDKTYVPSGSFIRVVMLSGLDAPTGGQAQQNPHPVLFRVLDPAQLPNLYKADVRDCFITGNGYGDISSERVHIRTDRMSCIDGEGRAIDLQLKGYIAGEDGKEGMRGRLISKQGQVIARAMLAGLADGLGNVIRASSFSNNNFGGAGGFTNQSLDGDRVVQAAGGGAISNAGSQLSRYYIKLAEQLFPVIEVDAGRTPDVVVSIGMSLDKLPQ